MRNRYSAHILYKIGGQEKNEEGEQSVRYVQGGGSDVYVHRKAKSGEIPSPSYEIVVVTINQEGVSSRRSGLTVLAYGGGSRHGV
jgi:hypothetical protein